MRLVLFDIDGTLLKTDGIGQRCTASALERVFGSEGNLDLFYPGGRTQEAIFRDTLADMGMGLEDYLKKREELYSEFLNGFQHSLHSGKHPIKALPGGKELVDLLAADNSLMLGLVTGNHTQNAALKLTAAGYSMNPFQVLAGGEQSADRGKLVLIALQQAKRLISGKVEGKDVIVIGDTTRDIQSAKAVGARSIAVATGTDSREMLQEFNPDWLLDDLSSTEQIRELITRN